MGIKNALKSLRHDMEMEQHEFAKFLGVRRQLYNKWEKQHGQPSLEMAMMIAHKTGRQVESFILYDEQSNSNE